MTIPQKIHAGTLDGAVIAKTDDYIAFLDHEPVSLGHTLVCPVRQHRSLFDLSDAERVEFLAFAEKVAQMLYNTYDLTGMSQIMNEGASNELDHLHLHLIPRYPGDGFTWTAKEWKQIPMPELQEMGRKIREGGSDDGKGE